MKLRSKNQSDRTVYPRFMAIGGVAGVVGPKRSMAGRTKSVSSVVQSITPVPLPAHLSAYCQLLRTSHFRWNSTSLALDRRQMESPECAAQFFADSVESVRPSQPPPKALNKSAVAASCTRCASTRFSCASSSARSAMSTSSKLDIPLS